MRSLCEIKDILAQHKLELAEKYSVKEIGIFGSYARGEQTDQSDLDVLVEFHNAPGLLRFIELEDYLSSLLGVHVELVRKRSIREELRDQILHEAIEV
ncbi:MAG: nucleotidyltransferase family protein [Armatimonadota bacterium]|nr:nucleotidyltransferase family protein [bacterium]MDW8321950.1 nucleotidyltransferase family protein [Armatimonadota bacterium]